MFRAQPLTPLTARLASASDEGPTRFRVRRWTAYTWAEDFDRRGATARLERMAELITRKLQQACPEYEPQVTAVTVDSRPQLCFTLIVPATTEIGAETRAVYWINRGLTARLGSSGELRTLRPVWGRIEIRRVNGG